MKCLSLACGRWVPNEKEGGDAVQMRRVRTLWQHFGLESTLEIASLESLAEYPAGIRYPNENGKYIKN